MHCVCVSQISGCFVQFSLLEIIFNRICRRPFPNSVRYIYIYIIRDVFNQNDAETNTRHANGHGSIRQNTQAIQRPHSMTVRTIIGNLTASYQRSATSTLLFVMVGMAEC